MKINRKEKRLPVQRREDDGRDKDQEKQQY